MNKYLLDTNALSRLLWNNIPEQWSQIWNQIRNKKALLILIEPVVSEMYYKNVQKFGDKEVVDKILWVKSLNTELYSLDDNDAIYAGKIKAKYPKTFSLVDCFILAVANKRHALVLTTDHDIRDEANKIKVNVNYIPLGNLV
ncbi:MAG: hypothetical protein CVT89_05750 [Candidatus Altiarchaeales archaeon HGW-Altiarchaeales-2]|nr:MAG: hypothetical protein CVT89_05750 [Candidatus Altiarchaeales archaeon HGW-Altiarchaeales-2]